MAVFRAMRRFHHEKEPEQVERVLTGFEDGRFLIDRMGAEGTVDRILLSCCSILDGGSETSTGTGRRSSC